LADLGDLQVVEEVLGDVGAVLAAADDE